MRRRPQRVAEAIKREASACILNMDGPDIGFITITRAEISADLKNAKLYYSALGDKPQRNRTIRRLMKVRGLIRKQIGDKLMLRYTPELTFIQDDSYDKVQRIEKILLQLEEERKESSPEDI